MGARQTVVEVPTGLCPAVVAVPMDFARPPPTLTLLPAPDDSHAFDHNV